MHSRRSGRLREALLGVAILVLLVGFFYGVFTRLQYHWNWAETWAYRGRFVAGWLTTVAVAAGSLSLSTVIGVVLLMAQRSPSRVLAAAARAFVEIVRGTPLLVQILIGYYIVANAFGIRSQVVSGVLLLSAFGGAYLGEIMRGGIESIGRSQFESARAVGFDRWQTYRHVIVPQAVRRVLPGAVGIFVMLIKDSSLLSVIGIEELTREAKNVGSKTYGQLEAYLPMAVGYLVLTLPIGWLSSILEKRYSYES